MSPGRIVAGRDVAGRDVAPPLRVVGCLSRGLCVVRGAVKSNFNMNVLVLRKTQKILKITPLPFF